MSVALVVDIIGDASKLVGELDKSSSKVGGFGDSLGGVALKATAIAGAAGIAAGAIAEMTTAAVADQAEQARLEAALQAAGVATGDYNAVVDEAIAKGQDRAFSDTQTREALQSLVTASGDLTQATADLSVAQDIARFANVDLATAADAVAKAQAGQAGPLAKLLPGLDKGASATQTLANATKMASGQADAYANSAQGMQDRAGDAFGELGETIGTAFLPVLEALLPAIIPLIQAFGKLIGAVLPLLTPILRLIGQALGFVVGKIADFVDSIVEMIDWVKRAVDAAGKFLDAMNPLKGISLPSLPFMNASTAAASSQALGRSGVATRAAPTAAPQIVIYTTGDSIDAEQAIVRALRRQARLNGAVVPAYGWAPSGAG